MKPVAGALFAVALIGAPILATPAVAAVDYSIALSNAAFAYSDGYWDRDHHWHWYRNKQEAEYFRTFFAAHYVNARHDHDRRDLARGWRKEHWWENEKR